MPLKLAVCLVCATSSRSSLFLASRLLLYTDHTLKTIMQQESYSENEKALCYHGPLIYEAVSLHLRKRERVQLECDMIYMKQIRKMTLLMPSPFVLITTTSVSPLLMLSYPCDALTESEYCRSFSFFGILRNKLMDGYARQILKAETWTDPKKHDDQTGPHYFVHYKGWKQT